MRLRLMAVAAPLAVLGLTACGDDGPSKKDFVTKADEICKDVEAKRDRTPYFRNLKSDNNQAPYFKQRKGELNATAYPRRMAAFADAADRLVSERVRRFKALELPSETSDRDQAKGYIRTLVRQRAASDRLETVIARQQKRIAPVVGRMELESARRAKQATTGPALRPATEAERRANRQYGDDNELTQAALNRITASLDRFTKADGAAATKAGALGMKACGGNSLFLSF